MYIWADMCSLTHPRANNLHILFNELKIRGKFFIHYFRPFAARVPKIETLACHICNNFNFMELTFQPIEL